MRTVIKLIVSSAYSTQFAGTCALKFASCANFELFFAAVPKRCNLDSTLLTQGPATRISDDYFGDDYSSPPVMFQHQHSNSQFSRQPLTAF